MSREVWIYYITRESHDGVLDQSCLLWGGEKPTRSSKDGAVSWGPKVFSDCYLGKYTTDDILRWFRTYPDSDMQCIVVEQYAHKPSPKKTQPKTQNAR